MAKAARPKGDEKLLVLALRDLSQTNAAIGDKPDDDTTLAKMGIGALYADRFLRPWINETFREPRGLPSLAPGKLKSSTKYAELKKMCGLGGGK